MLFRRGRPGVFYPTKGGMRVVSSRRDRVEIPAKSILEQNWNIRERLAICG
jgi:hypothetical protein